SRLLNGVTFDHYFFCWFVAAPSSTIMQEARKYFFVIFWFNIFNLFTGRRQNTASQRRCLSKVRAAKEFYFNKDGSTTKKLQIGVNKLGDLVGVTLGPKGRNVVLERKYGSPKIVNDGVTVANEVKLEDPAENIGAKLVRQAAVNTNDLADDGTTTSVVLAQGLIEEGVKVAAVGANPVQITRGIKKTTKALVVELKLMPKEVEDSKQADVGTVVWVTTMKLIMMWKVMVKCHHNQCQAITEAKNLDAIASSGKLTDAHFEVIKQIELELRRWTSNFCGWVTTQKQYIKALNGWLLKCLFIEPEEIADGVVPFSLGWIGAPPIFVICNQWTQSMEDMILKEEVVQALRGFAWSVRYLREWHNTKLRMKTMVDTKALKRDELKIQKEWQRGVLKIVTLKAPGFRECKSQYLDDITIFSGVTVIREKAGLSLDKAEKEVLGHTGKVVLTKEVSTIVGNRSTQDAVNKSFSDPKPYWGLPQSLRYLAFGVTEQNYEKEKLNERIAKLSGGVAVIQVAVEEGIIVGGDCTLLRLVAKVDTIKLTLDNDKQKVGADIVKRALSYPLKLIAKNKVTMGVLSWERYMNIHLLILA
ncbi:hypothetical protein GIB67_029194, partial [Kingdonia uniflora]